MANGNGVTRPYNPPALGINPAEPEFEICDNEVRVVVVVPYDPDYPPAAYALDAANRLDWWVMGQTVGELDRRGAPATGRGTPLPPAA